MRPLAPEASVLSRSCLARLHTSPPCSATPHWPLTPSSPMIGVLLLTLRELRAKWIVVGLFVIATLLWGAMALALQLDIVDGSLAGARLFGQEADFSPEGADYDGSPQEASGDARPSEATPEASVQDSAEVSLPRGGQHGDSRARGCGHGRLSTGRRGPL